VGPLFLILWILAQSQAGIRIAGETNPLAKPKLIEPSAKRSPETAPMPRPRGMSMYSAYLAPENEEQKFEVRCKTERSLSNVDPYIPIEAVAEEDVVGRAGKILIPAGTKILGKGYCDAETSRILSRGKWTFYASDHQITVEATMRDVAHKEGLESIQFSEGMDQQRVKQAIYRDGAYLYVPSQTEFILEIQGNITVQDLPSAYQK
jgi:hypothetical protein